MKSWTLLVIFLKLIRAIYFLTFFIHVLGQKCIATLANYNPVPTLAVKSKMADAIYNPGQSVEEPQPPPTRKRKVSETITSGNAETGSKVQRMSNEVHPNNLENENENRAESIEPSLSAETPSTSTSNVLSQTSGTFAQLISKEQELSAERLKLINQFKQKRK